MRFSARRWTAPEYEAASGRGPIPSNASWKDILWNYVVPWLGGKMLSLGWTFVSAVASYSPFLLMTLVENKMDEHRWKTIAQRQMRAREDFAMEEFSAYKDGDDVDQYVEAEEQEEEEENAEVDNEELENEELGEEEGYEDEENGENEVNEVEEGRRIKENGKEKSNKN